MLATKSELGERTADVRLGLYSDSVFGLLFVTALKLRNLVTRDRALDVVEDEKRGRRNKVNKF